MSNTKEKKKMGLTTKIFISLLAGALFGVILCYLCLLYTSGADPEDPDTDHAGPHG